MLLKVQKNSGALEYGEVAAGTVCEDRDTTVRVHFNKPGFFLSVLRKIDFLVAIQISVGIYGGKVKIKLTRSRHCSSHKLLSVPQVEWRPQARWEFQRYR